MSYVDVYFRCVENLTQILISSPGDLTLSGAGRKLTNPLRICHNGTTFSQVTRAQDDKNTSTVIYFSIKSCVCVSMESLMNQNALDKNEIIIEIIVTLLY